MTDQLARIDNASAGRAPARPESADVMTRPQNVLDIYDAIPIAEKSLYSIEGTDRRFDG